jgi:hypothetical protein
MTDKSAFTEEEWETLRRSPLVAGMAISLADPGGPIEVLKETSAVMKVVTEAATERDDVVGAVAKDVREQAQARHNPVGDFKPRGATAAKEILDEVGRAGQIAEAKADPAEAQAFKEWLLECSQRAADAAKEGGFMGFKAVQVSEGEQKMLDEVRKALGLTAA